MLTCLHVWRTWNDILFANITEWLETTSSTKVTKTCGMIAAGRGCGVFYSMSRSLSGFLQFTVDVKFINLVSASKGAPLFDQSVENLKRMRYPYFY